MFFKNIIIAILALQIALPRLALSEEVSLTGLYIGGPSEESTTDKGSISGLVGIRYFYLNYKRSFNYFATVGFTADALSEADAFDRATEIDEVPENAVITDSVYSGFLVSGGLSYNTNRFDSVIVYAGPELGVGESLLTFSNSSQAKIEDLRFGAIAGIALGLEKMFIGIDYSTNTESLRLAAGIVF